MIHVLESSGIVLLIILALFAGFVLFAGWLLGRNFSMTMRWHRPWRFEMGGYVPSNIDVLIAEAEQRARYRCDICGETVNLYVIPCAQEPTPVTRCETCVDRFGLSVPAPAMRLQVFHDRKDAP